MSPQQTASVYDKIAHHWDCPELDARHGIAQHERALAFASGGGIALDIGCGASGRIIDLLLRRGYDVEGLDLSTVMLRRARAHHPHVRFHWADVCAWEFPRRYDFISAWDSIWHVPLKRQLEVIRKIADGLSAGGIFIFTTGGIDHPGEVTNPCFGEPLYHAAPGIPAVLRALLDCGCSCRHLEYDQHPQNHVYVIAQKV